jgi:hypothetical protein
LESGVKLSDDMRKICFSSSFDLNKKISLLPTWRLATISRSSAAPRYTAARNAADPDTQVLPVLVLVPIPTTALVLVLALVLALALVPALVQCRPTVLGS